MTTTFKTLLILIASVVLFSSCEKECTPVIAEPTPDDQTWLVYKPGDTAKFVNQNGEPVNFIRTNVRVNAVAGDNVDPNAECVDQLNTEVLNVIEDLGGNFPGLATYLLKRPAELKVMVVGQPNFAFELDENAPTFPAQDVNGTNYMSVYEVIPDASTAENSIKRLLFNKEFGFLSVEYNDGRKLERRF